MRRNTVSSFWPVEAIFNYYYNNEKTFAIDNGTAVFRNQLKETWMNFVKVVVYPVGSCLFHLDLA